MLTDNMIARIREVTPFDSKAFDALKYEVQTTGRNADETIAGLRLELSVEKHRTALLSGEFLDLSKKYARLMNEVSEVLVGKK